MDRGLDPIYRCNDADDDTDQTGHQPTATDRAVQRDDQPRGSQYAPLGLECYRKR